MELTKDQINEVENYLKKRGLVYVDIYNEVLDHICTDIEKNMEVNNKSFDFAYKKSIEKWHAKLENHSNIVLGLAYSRPKIVINKSLKIYRYWAMAILLVMIVPAFFIKSNLELFTFNMSYILSPIIALFLIQVVLYLFIRRAGVKTTFSFLYSIIVLPSAIFAILASINIVAETRASYTGFVFALVYLLHTMFGYTLLKKHIKIVKQLAIR